MNRDSWHHQLSDMLFGKKFGVGVWEQLAVDGLMFVGVLLVASVLYLLTKRVILRLVERVVHRSSTDWDDALLESRVFRWVALLIPTVLIWKTVGDVFKPDAFGEESRQTLVVVIGDVIRVVTQILMILLALFAFYSVLNVGERIYSRYAVSRKMPLKSFVQVIKVILALVCVIFIISSLIGKSPVLIFSGLGAATAILMLIFKDVILGLVAGVQLSANQMVANGDWIEMPKYGADGEVIEVALTTVKVRNWDKTITMVPTYSLISDGFKNWRGMSDSGVRRIKRSLSFDMQSVRFLDNDMLERAKNVGLLKDYLERTLEEVREWNEKQKLDEHDLINARALTNIGTFRAYVAAYLHAHREIDEGETILVRQLQPGENGLPIEVYAFTNVNAWLEYERIQSDIFDHLMAVAPLFGLRIFQRPSGVDFERFKAMGTG